MAEKILDNSRKSADLEKNEISFQHPIRTRSKSLLLILTILEFIALVVVVHHREVIDNVHQLLNSVLLGIFSAVLGQSIIQLFRQVHYNRLGKFVIWGAVNGALSSLWIDLLIYRFPDVISRVLVDQLVGSPIFQLIFVILNCLFENSNISIAMKTTYITTLKVCYMFWPICSIVSFQFLPPHLIFPFNCFISLIWNVVLSLLT